MTLDEAIKHSQFVADTNCDQCAEDHRQLAEWLKELKELRKHGWHPASELPPVGENGNSTDLIAIDEDNEPIKVSYNKFHKCWVMVDATAESFDKIKIKCWCYTPKED